MAGEGAYLAGSGVAYRNRRIRMSRTAVVAVAAVCFVLGIYLLIYTPAIFGKVVKTEQLNSAYVLVWEYPEHHHAIKLAGLLLSYTPVAAAYLLYRLDLREKIVRVI